MNVIFVAFYTKNSPYEAYAYNLAQSLHQFNLPYKIVGIDDQGNWDKNTHYKPRFLRQMLDDLAPCPLVYIDVDALVHREPILFEQLTEDRTVDVAAYILNHKRFGRQVDPELLSGTLYLSNTFNTRQIIDRWTQLCDQCQSLWDQAALSQALKEHNYKGFRELPEQYCTIYDYMVSVVDPVVVHYQASRTCRTLRPAVKGIKYPR